MLEGALRAKGWLRKQQQERGAEHELLPKIQPGAALPRSSWEVWGRTLRCSATPSISASRLHPSPARLRAEERGLGKGTLPRRGDGGGWQGSAAGSVPRREAVLGREWF